MALHDHGGNDLAGGRISMEGQQPYLQCFCRRKRAERILKLDNERASPHFRYSALTGGEYVSDQLGHRFVGNAIDVTQFLLRPRVLPKTHTQHRPGVETLLGWSALVFLARLGRVLQGIHCDPETSVPEPWGWHRAYFYQPKNNEEGRFLIDYLS